MRRKESSLEPGGAVDNERPAGAGGSAGVDGPAGAGERNDRMLRLIFGALGSAAVAAVSLTLAFALAFDLASMEPPHPKDPDGPKALGLVATGLILGTLFGVAGVIDLLRTVRKIRALSAAAPSEERAGRSR